MNKVTEIFDDQGVLIRRRVQLVCETPSCTKQAMRDECDINGIMRRFERTGLITHNAVREAYFDDVSEVPDFATAVETVRKASEMFMSLPAKIRSRFDNEPARYVEFCSDPANSDEMIQLGLKPAPDAPPAPVEVRVVSEPAAGGGA